MPQKKGDEPQEESSWPSGERQKEISQEAEAETPKEPSSIAGLWPGLEQRIEEEEPREAPLKEKPKARTALQLCPEEQRQKEECEGEQKSVHI